MTEDKKIDPFKPQQPSIPGVSASAGAAQKPPPPKSPAAPKNVTAEGLPAIWVALIVLVCVLCVGFAWLSHHSSATEAVAPGESEAPLPVVEAKPKPVESLPEGPGPVATTDELKKIWSSKRFLFRNFTSSDEAPAIVVHLPSGEYWGLSLREPYGTCELEYVTDMAKLQSDYNFHGEHPMVGDTCNRSVFDLTKYGSGPNGLVRGEIVQGAAVRPPMAIEIQKKGDKLIAVRME